MYAEAMDWTILTIIVVLIFVVDAGYRRWLRRER